MGVYGWNCRETKWRFPVKSDENRQTIWTERINRSVRSSLSCSTFLLSLICRCEVALISAITVRNCLKFYKIAEEIHANVLQTHCSQLISTHWVNALNNPRSFQLEFERLYLDWFYQWRFSNSFRSDGLQIIQTTDEIFSSSSNTHATWRCSLSLPDRQRCGRKTINENRLSFDVLYS